MNPNHSFVFAALLVATPLANAGIPVYTDEVSFLNDLINPGVTENYESYAVDVVNGPQTIALDLFSVTTAGPGAFGVSDSLNIPNGIQPVDGNQHLQTTFGGGGSVTVTFAFDAPIEAFGTYFTDLELSSLSVEVFLDNGQSFNAGDFGPDGNGGMAYFGLQPIQAGIDSIAFTMNSQTPIDDVFFDRTTITVPAPGTASLLTVGLLAVRRRR